MMKRSLPAFAAAVLAAPFAAAGVATTSYSAAQEGPNPKALRIADAPGGGAAITVKLAGLTKATRILKARLRACRGKLEDPKDLLADIEIHPGKKPAGKPLKLAGPWSDAFDATAAVQAAVAAGGELSLFVKRFGGWQKGRTRLEVAYDGKPALVPTAAGGLKAFHRAGQTFLTWKEVDPLLSAEKATWGEIRDRLAKAADAFTYRIYTHSRPIDAATFASATFLAEVAPLSCWNVNGRNMEYLIGQAMIQSDEMGELARGHNHEMYTWGMNHPRMDRYPVQRLVIDAKVGPLPPGSGLYVHTPAAPGKRYYAVVSCRGGIENTVDFSAANSLAKPLAEAVGPGEPVHQGEGLWGPYFDYPGRRQVYVQWVGPPLSPLPSMYFNWSVLVPPKARPGRPGVKEGQKLPVELYFHSGNFSYAKPRQKFVLHSVQIAPHDWPASGWYGYNDAFGTLKSYRSGTVSNHTQRRIIAFLDWAQKQFGLDEERILLPGSDGAALLALNYPEKFSYVLINKFENAALFSPDRFLPAWGPKSPDIKDDKGRAEWGWAMLDDVVLAQRKRDLPLFFCRGYSWGPFVRGFARGKGRFYTAMRKANQPIVADWTWASGQLVKPNRYTGAWRGMDITRTTPMPAFANCSLDSNKEGDGQTNFRLGWKDLTDGPDAVSVVISSHRDATLDLAFRRLQKFRVRPGQKLLWEATSAQPRRGEKPSPQSGSVTVDADGVFVVKGLKSSGRTPLTVKISRRK